MIYLPDISEWDIKKVITIKGMFKGCSSLKSLPDISKWNTKSLKNKREIFAGCSLLKSLPEIIMSYRIKIVLTGESCVGCRCLYIAALGLEFRGDFATIGWEERRN